MNKNKKPTLLEAAISAAFKTHFDGVPIPVLDIPKIYAQCESAWIDTPIRDGESSLASIDHIMATIAKRYK